MNFVTDRTVRFIKELKMVTSLEELQTFMESTLEDLNVKNFALFEFGLAEQDTRGVNNYPAMWVQRYREKRYEFVDPVAVKALRTRSAFRWESLGPEGFLEPKRGQTVMSEGAEFGIHDGYTFPILHTNGYMAMVSYATDQLEDDPHLAPAMHLIALYLHAKYRALRGMDNQEPIPELTPRERECLTWAACGKTDWEVGEILSIGEGTVHTHIESAKRKFGVTTRIQAVVESMRHHLIHI